MPLSISYKGMNGAPSRVRAESAFFHSSDLSSAFQRSRSWYKKPSHSLKTLSKLLPHSFGATPFPMQRTFTLLHRDESVETHLV